MKVLVSDYDQTLYRNDVDAEKNIKALIKFKKDGNLFIIATGRSYLDFRNVFDKYNFKCDYVLLDHGSTIIDSSDNVIYNTHIDDEIVQKIKDDLSLDTSIRYFCCSSLESRVSFDYKNISKINVKYKTRDEAKEKVKAILDKYSNYINAYHVSESTVEIISNKISKVKAIRILSKKLNIPDEDIYTIGDGYSDIEMVKTYNGYCVKNAVSELKEVAIKEYENVYDLIKDLQM